MEPTRKPAGTSRERRGASSAYPIFLGILCATFAVSACDDDALDPPEAGVDASVDALLDDSMAIDVAPGVTVAEGCESSGFDWGAGGEWMLPGTDCISCHRLGGSAADSVFTAAGTVFSSPECATGLEGIRILIEDDAGRELELVSNRVGNFFSDEPLQPPLRIAVARADVQVHMQSRANSGACGACHDMGASFGLVWGPTE